MILLLERFQRLKGELAWVVAGHAAAFLGGLLGIKVLTGLLGPTGYGELALGLTVAGFLTTFLHNPLSNAVSRFYASYRGGGRGRVYFAVLRQLHRNLLLLLLPFTLVVPLMVIVLKDAAWGTLLLWGMVFGMISGIGVSLLAWQNAARDRKSATLAQIGDVWLRIGLAIAAVSVFGTGRAALGGYCAGAVLVLLWQYRRATQQELSCRQSEPSPTDEELHHARQEFVAFALPFVGYSLFTVVALYADRWILQILAGAGAVGIYAALFQIAASPVNLLFAVVNQLMIPIIYERAGTMTTGKQRFETRRLIRNTVLATVALSVAGTALTALLAHPLASMLTTGEFARHAAILWVLVLGLALWQVGQLLTLQGNCLHRPGIYLWPKGLHAVLFCALGAYLTSCFGIIGMAAALTCSSAVYCVAVLLVNIRLQRMTEGLL